MMQACHGEAAAEPNSGGPGDETGGPEIQLTCTIHVARIWVNLIKPDLYVNN